MPPILFRLDGAHFGQSARRGVGPFESPILAQGTYLRVFGVTKDSAGTALPACDVHLFRTFDDAEVDQVTSDASGNYEFRSASLSTTYYVVAYKAGATDVAGTTVNTLIGS